MYSRPCVTMDSLIAAKSSVTTMYEMMEACSNLMPLLSCTPTHQLDASLLRTTWCPFCHAQLDASLSRTTWCRFVTHAHSPAWCLFFTHNLMPSLLRTTWCLFVTHNLMPLCYACSLTSLMPLCHARSRTTWCFMSSVWNTWTQVLEV